MSEDSARMATGYFWSILAMMSAPFLIVGLFTFLIMRALKKARSGPAEN